jgi:hypothetical protein
MTQFLKYNVQHAAWTMLTPSDKPILTGQREEDIVVYATR